MTEVADEEASGFRMLNLLQALHIRSLPIPESCHPFWNDVERALVSSKLKGAVLKASLLTNHYRGPFNTKKNRYTMQEGASLLVESPEAVLTREKILEARGVKNRLPQASRLNLEILFVDVCVLVFTNDCI